MSQSDSKTGYAQRIKIVSLGHQQRDELELRYHIHPIHSLCHRTCTGSSSRMSEEQPLLSLPDHFLPSNTRHVLIPLPTIFSLLISETGNLCHHSGWHPHLAHSLPLLQDSSKVLLLYNNEDNDLNQSVCF